MPEHPFNSHDEPVSTFAYFLAEPIAVDVEILNHLLERDRESWIGSESAPKIVVRVERTAGAADDSGWQRSDSGRHDR